LKRRFGLALAALLLVVPALLAVAAAAPAQGGPGSSLGIQVVRFVGGTSPAQMRAAVANAGGTVVGDLSAANALAVLPGSASFSSAIVAQPGVAGAFSDRPVDGLHGRDDGHGGGPGHGPPGDGRKGASVPDPWHDLTSFWGETNPTGILQWDDDRMDVPEAWKRTTGSSSVDVAVLDSGVDASHRELRPVVDSQTNEIPCKELRQDIGDKALMAMGLTDCGDDDRLGHGSWVASRVAGALNGFASNGVAPGVDVASYKVDASGFGALTSWVVAGMLDACSHGADLVNLSISGYEDPSDPASAQEYLMWVDAVSYCRSQGAAVIAAAGNEHVRIDRVDMNVGGRDLHGVGVVADDEQGFATPLPGQSADEVDARGLLESPGGVPGVIMVAATNNANASAPSSVPAAVRPPASYSGLRDQLAYYSNYGSRVDIAAPGGARKYNIPLYDGGAGDFLYGGWGSFGALPKTSDLCAASGDVVDAACFDKDGNGFGWLQGTSVAAPNLTGVAALVLSAHPDLRGNPDGLLARLQSTARHGLVNATGPNDPGNTAAGASGRPCPSGYCHLDYVHPIPFAQAYGAGLVDAAAAVR
jgi:subtilase family protein